MDFKKIFSQKWPLYSYETSKEPLHSVFLLKHPLTDGEGLKKLLLIFRSLQLSLFDRFTLYL